MKKILMVLVLFGLFVPCTFAANLDDPVPSTKPTIRSEINRGYGYAQSIAESTPYNHFIFKSLDKEAQNLSNKSDAFMAGYWIGAWQCNINDERIGKEYGGIEWDNHNELFYAKFSDCCRALGLKEKEVAESVGIILSK